MSEHTPNPAVVEAMRLVMLCSNCGDPKERGGTVFCEACGSCTSVEDFRARRRPGRHRPGHDGD